MAYDNNNSGALFKNARKLTDKHPDYSGSVNVDGVDYWVSGWIKTPKAGGDKFLSVSLTKKDAPAAAPRQQSTKPNLDFDDDIPF